MGFMELMAFKLCMRVFYVEYLHYKMSRCMKKLQSASNENEVSEIAQEMIQTGNLLKKYDPQSLSSTNT